MNSAIEPKATRKRVVYLDWLRILAVLLLVPFHVTRLFDVFEPFYVKNAELSVPLSGIIGLVVPWHMPLLFLLAGAATWFALGFRSSGTYLVERLKRLLIPFVFGVLVIVPPQMYYAQRHHAHLADSYLQYYPNLFQAPAGTDYYGVGISFAHLWFILFLFFMSLVALPLFVWLRRPSGQRLIARLADLCGKPGVLILMVIPLIVADSLPSILGKEGFIYLFVFVYGFVLVANAGFQEIIDRNKRSGLVLGIVSMASLFALLLFTEARPGGPGWLGDLFDLCVDVSMWSWLVAILGYGRQLLDRTTGALAYLNEMVYPFYILHQTVIVVIGFYVVQWDMNLYAKFLVMLVAAFAGTVAIYDLVVRRVNVLRFLFGMKPKPPAAEPGQTMSSTGPWGPHLLSAKSRRIRQFDEPGSLG